MAGHIRVRRGAQSVPLPRLGKAIRDNAGTVTSVAVERTYSHPTESKRSLLYLAWAIVVLLTVPCTAD
jgi:hypothetical protein